MSTGQARTSGPADGDEFGNECSTAMRAIENEVAELHAYQDNGLEIDEDRFAALAKRPATEPMGYIARRELRSLKYDGRGSHGGGTGRGRSNNRTRPGPSSPEERRRRIEEPKKRAICRDCGLVGHWSGDKECRARGEGRPPPRSDRGRFVPQSRASNGGGRARREAGTATSRCARMTTKRRTSTARRSSTARRTVRPGGPGQAPAVPPPVPPPVCFFGGRGCLTEVADGKGGGPVPGEWGQ